MKQSTPTSTGASLNGSEPTGLSTDQTPTSNAQTTSNESASNPQSTQSEGFLPPYFAEFRRIMAKHKVELPFEAQIEMTDLIYNVWSAGFNERSKLQAKCM